MLDPACDLITVAAAAQLTPPERYEIDSDRLNWPLEQSSGVPGLPDGVAVMPSARSHQAVLLMRCASGKTYTVRRDLVDVAAVKLIIVVTCNRLFTTATCRDWLEIYGEDNVYCYLDGLGKGAQASAAKQRLKDMCTRGRGVLFISIESFLVLNNGMLDPNSVGALLLEETCELASKMLSATCPCVRPFRLLKAVASRAERVIYTDADFEADGPLDGRCLRLAKYLCPDMPVRIFTLSRSAEHTKRSAQIFFDDPDAEGGVGFDAWIAQLGAYLGQWRRTGDAKGNRVAVACASRPMVRRVVALALQHGCYWCDYTSETDDYVKSAELSDPETHWVEIALVAFTQTLSVGADPKAIQFAAVFMYVAGWGCTVRALAQGALRFGRAVEFALRCTTVYICMKGRPKQQAVEAEVIDQYQAALTWLRTVRSERLRTEQLMRSAVGSMASIDSQTDVGRMHAYGGARSTYTEPTEEELGIAAWAVAEQWEQRADLWGVLKRTLERHGWVANGAALDAQAASAFATLPSPTDGVASTIQLHEISVSQQVSSLMEPEQQFEFALKLIRSGNFASIEAFHEHCYQIVDQNFHTACDKLLLRTWTLLHRLPCQIVNEVTAVELVELSKRREAIELHALGICVGSVQLLAQEALKRKQEACRLGAERPSPRVTQGRKLEALERLAEVLLTSASATFFVNPGDASQTLGTAKPSVVRALEAARRDVPSPEKDELLETLRGYEGPLGIQGEQVGLAATLKRICRSAYVHVKPETREVALDDGVEHDIALVGPSAPTESSNAARRRANARAAAGQPLPKKARCAKQREIVAVTFERCTFSCKRTTSGADGIVTTRDVTCDYALDFKVESPHAKGLHACARQWQTAHDGTAHDGTARFLAPSDLRRAIEEDLGINEAPDVPPPGQGPCEDRPRGNARATGVLSATTFTPAPTPRKTADGYVVCSEALPWARATELMDLIAAQLALTIDADMRTVLERGRTVLARLRRDAASQPTDALGLKWKATYYARRLPFGRLTAGASSMQPMPNLLRQWLYTGILHDLDYVNAHPTIMLGLVKQLRPQTWERDAPRLASYVSGRLGFLDRIMHWYGLPGRDFAKTVILVVINNGSLRYWRRRVKSPASPQKPDLPELEELQREVLWLRGLVFNESVFAPHIGPLKDRIRQLRRNAGKTPEEIDRSAFAYVIGHLESIALDAACGVLRQHGFVPTSLIYDGCLTTHNPTGDLNAAMRAAEAAVEQALGFSGLVLKEKDMFALAPFSLTGGSLTLARQAALSQDAAVSLAIDGGNNDD